MKTRSPHIVAVPRRGPRQRGFTLAEVGIASTIATFVMAGVLSLQYLSVRIIKEVYGPTDARTSRMNALNQLRLRLADGKIDTVELSEPYTEDGTVKGYQRIEYFDPFRDSTCAFEFVVPEGQTKGNLYFWEDLSEEPTIVSRGPINIYFNKGFYDPVSTSYVNQETMVTLHVRTSSILAYADVDERDGETIVYLRNP